MLDLDNIVKSSDSRRIDAGERILVSHQAEFLPWLGFISKATMGDVYFLLDHVQFEKEYFENRNKIRFNSDNGWKWLSIPIKNKREIHLMRNVLIHDPDKIKRLLDTIKASYKKAPYFKDVFPSLELIFNKEYSHLLDLNLAIIQYAFEMFDIKVPVFRTSKLIEAGYKIDGVSSELVLNMCKVAKADVFVAGVSGKDYLDRDLFKSNGVKLVFQKFTHPAYAQLQGDFIAGMSFIDLLFNKGRVGAIKVLRKSDYEI